VRLVRNQKRDTGSEVPGLAGVADQNRLVAPSDATKSGLEIEDLTFSYLMGGRRIVAVRKASFDVPAGTTVGLVGESGSGKSTVALSVMRLIRPPIGEIEAGSIRLGGVDLLQLDKARMRAVLHTEIGYIPQDPAAALDPLCTIGKHVDETLSDDVRGPDRRQAIVALLDSLGVRNAADRLGSYPHEFSGGMKQRVAIATALARQPKLIIADEPTTALDVTTQLGILRLLDRMRAERGLSMLFVTHDLSVARMLCQRVVVMYAGTVVEKGPTDEVINRPRHPYTRALVGAIPRMGAAPRTKLRAIPGQQPPAGQIGTGCPFAPRCPLADARCRQENPTLELYGDVMAACWHADHAAGQTGIDSA
jgi:oligopeptide/dipeptide ABC transporter ATP-binding protein